jgi:DNA polymerase III subunit delta'
MVEEVREQVIRAAAYRPYEGNKRVFVIEAAEAMRDESQNALLKTLEEPAEFVHVLLLTSEPAALLETIASRCQPIDFAPLPTEAVEAALAGLGDPADEVATVARLAAGDLTRAHLLLSEEGKRLRASALELGEPGPTAHPAPRTAAPPWRALLTTAEATGTEAEDAARDALEEEKSTGLKRSARDISDASKRAGRRRRTEILDLGLELYAAWFRDLAAVASGAEDVVFNRDRLGELRAQAKGLDPGRARRAVELVEDTRRRLSLNVSEELALEALSFRLERELA